MKNISKMKVLTTATVVLWLLFTTWILNLIGLKTAWPIYTVINLAYLTSFDKKNIMKIFLSCTLGLILAAGYTYSVAKFSYVLGSEVSIYGLLFISLMLSFVIDSISRMVINTYTLIAFTYSLVDAKALISGWPQILLTIFVGGGIGLIGVFIAYQLENKLLKIKKIKVH
jgi:uncharacterized membrane protein YgaE (UPF0421/DUF939 family)